MKELGKLSPRQRIVSAIGAAAIVVATFGSGCAENPNKQKPKNTLSDPSKKEISDQEILEIMDSYEKQGQPIVLDTWTSEGGAIVSNFVTPGTSKNYYSTIRISRNDVGSNVLTFYSPIEGQLNYDFNKKSFLIETNNISYRIEVSGQFNPTPVKGQKIGLREAMFTYKGSLGVSISSPYFEIKVIDLKEPPLLANLVTPTPSTYKDLKELTPQELSRWSESGNWARDSLTTPIFHSFGIH